MKSCLFRYIKILLLLILATILAILIFIYSGTYQIGADVPHNKVTFWLLETLRERSVAKAAANVHVPDDLSSPARLLRGGPDYNEMCVSCHLSPSVSKTDFTLGLYPSPPNLTKPTDWNIDEIAADQRRFWIIKHGIKASAMPSWAPGHDDQRIWDIVAFLKKLPELSPDQYQILTARGSEESPHSH
ncbi:cytochrome c [Methylophaga sp.]|uniref:c-type cytochrome n=1 Tax=Methylophaga sp. TaxID=2024840 RepID=UPI0014008DDD|nr:cytochrome c [Methylophaga sp.]MTI62522.1 cytochrome c [Methylophaga sp.]